MQKEVISQLIYSKRKYLTIMELIHLQLDSIMSLMFSIQEHLLILVLLVTTQIGEELQQMFLEHVGQIYSSGMVIYIQLLTVQTDGLLAPTQLIH